MKMLQHVPGTVLQRTGNTVSVAMKMLQPVPPSSDATGSQKAFYQVCTDKRHILEHISIIALLCNDRWQSVRLTNPRSNSTNSASELAILFTPLCLCLSEDIL